MKYTRIDIKTKDDLPKEEDFYPVQRKDGIVEWEAWEPSKDKGYVDLWLNTIDWYLIEDTEPSYPEPFIEWIAIELKANRLEYNESDNSFNFYDSDIDYDVSNLLKYWNEIKNK